MLTDIEPITTLMIFLSERISEPNVVLSAIGFWNSSRDAYPAPCYRRSVGRRPSLPYYVVVSAAAHLPPLSPC